MSGRRSMVPRVAGTLMIIFGGLGLLSGLLFMVAGDFSSSTLPPQLRQRIRDLVLLDQGVGLLLSGAQLTAGILAVTYRRSAPFWALGYGVLTLAKQVIRLLVYFQTLAPALSGLIDVEDQVPRISRAFWIVAVIYGVWGILMALLMWLPASRGSCRGSSSEIS